MFRRRCLTPTLVLLPLLFAGSLAPAAEARRGPCVPGQKKPVCHVSTGKIIAVADGDTVHARIREKGGWSDRKLIRMTGVQTMELTDYSRGRSGRRGHCHGVEAAERLEYLLQGRRVRKRKIRVAVQKLGRTTGGRRHRLRGGIAYRSGGRWQDAGVVLLREGHGLWLPNQKEWAWNRVYSKAAAQAAQAGRNLWDSDSCGPGPQQEIPLALKVKWDANGKDGANKNGEWVRITNTDPVNDLSLARWWVRDSFLRRYTFPGGAVVRAGESIRVHVGNGRNDATSFYWGEPKPVFENVGARGVGDGAYLFDPQGDLRASVMYPCRLSCGEPLRKKVRMTAHKRAPESIRITNISNGQIDLSEYEVESSPWFYEFGRGTSLAPGQSIVVWIGKRAARGSGTSLTEIWGFDKYLLSDKKDVVTLRNPLGAPVTCHSWGRGTRCPRF